jgi:hypothetical protein
MQLFPRRRDINFSEEAVAPRQPLPGYVSKNRKTLLLFDGDATEVSVLSPLRPLPQTFVLDKCFWSKLGYGHL